MNLRNATPAMTPKKRILLAVTGASGMAYAKTLALALGENKNIELHMIVSRAGYKVLEVESGADPRELTAQAARVHEPEDISAPCASGSWIHHGMVVCPCSMATLAAIANGVGSNLIHRAADVTLKERRPLVLVARETPLSQIHLKNMLALSRAGAVIAPACPAFYPRPETIQDMVDHFTARILDQLDIPHNLSRRWGEED